MTKDVTAQSLMADNGMSASDLVKNSSVNDNVVSGNDSVTESDLLKLVGSPLAPYFGTVQPYSSIKVPAVMSGQVPTSNPGNVFEVQAKKWNEFLFTAPLLQSELDTIPDQNAIIILNYTKGELKGSAFLDYAQSLNHNVDIAFSSTIQFEEYEELVLAFMERKDPIQISVLLTMVAEIMLFAKGMDPLKSPYAVPVPEDFARRFYVKHLALVTRWLIFVDSFQIFAIYALEALNKHYKPAEHFPVIDDDNHIGGAVVLLFLMPEFTAHYFSIADAKYHLFYFKQQYEVMTFGGEPMTTYFRSKNNYLCPAMENLVMGYYCAKDIDLGIFSQGVFAPDYPIGEFQSGNKVQ